MKFAPYSFSKLSLYDKCPYQWRLKYLNHVIWAEPSKATERGKYIHQCLETFPHLREFEFKFLSPDEVKEIHRYLDKIVAIDFVHDHLIKYCLRKEFEINLGFNFEYVDSKEKAMLHGFIDYIGQKKKGEIIVIDWKTGKSTADDFQLEFYACWAFAVFKNINTVSATFVYIDLDKTRTLTFTRDQFDSLKAKIMERINKIEATEVFEKKVNQYCTHCLKFNECNPFRISTKGEKANGTV
jgi:RecB family exonuclease